MVNPKDQLGNSTDHGLFEKVSIPKSHETLVESLVITGFIE